MSYENIRKARVAEIVEQSAISCDRIREAIESKNTWWLAEWTTNLRARQVLNGVITIDKFIELAHKKAEKVIAKRIASLDEKLERIASSDTVESITISVDWVRNSTWGNNPHAEVEVCTANRCATYTGTASGCGCGYDKESVSIAQALNQSSAVLKLLYDNKERALQKDEKATSRGVLGYGSGYHALPYFDGGAGIDCFASIFEGLSYDKGCPVAYKWEHIACGKRYDVYTVRREAENLTKTMGV